MSRIIALGLVSVLAACDLASVLLPQPPCGFPPGTVLAYSGRSTTAALGVAEGGLNDPLSDDPADIYITAHPVEMDGVVQGPLVCAIYVEPEGFTEITEVPAGWQLPRQ